MHKWLMGLLLAILFAFGAVSTGCVDVGEDDGTTPRLSTWIRTMTETNTTTEPASLHPA